MRIYLSNTEIFYNETLSISQYSIFNKAIIVAGFCARPILKSRLIPNFLYKVIFPVMRILLPQNFHYFEVGSEFYQKFSIIADNNNKKKLECFTKFQ